MRIVKVRTAGSPAKCPIRTTAVRSSRNLMNQCAQGGQLAQARGRFAPESSRLRLVILGHFTSESVASFNRNQWLTSVGFGKHFMFRSLRINIASVDTKGGELAHLN